MENPNYYAILPADVRYDKRLKANEKILYSEITALANAKGYCYAKNQYFAELYDVHKNTISSWISHLCELGYLRLELIVKGDSKEIQERRIYISVPPINENIDTPQSKDLYPINENIDTPQSKDLYPINENIDTPINQKIEDNITSMNNTSKNIEREKEADPFTQSGTYYQEIRMLLASYSINYEKIARLGKPISRIKEVLRIAKENGKSEGWIVGALTDDYNLEYFYKPREIKKEAAKKKSGKVIDSSEYEDFSGDYFEKYIGKGEEIA